MYHKILLFLCVLKRIPWLLAKNTKSTWSVLWGTHPKGTLMPGNKRKKHRKTHIFTRKMQRSVSSKGATDTACKWFLKNKHFALFWKERYLISNCWENLKYFTSLYLPKVLVFYFLQIYQKQTSKAYGAREETEKKQRKILLQKCSYGYILERTW